MSQLNRENAPDFGVVEQVNLIEPFVGQLKNGIPVYMINAGTQDIVKVELVFRAGVSVQDKMLQASSTNAMLEEGTTKRKGEDIAEALDYYGSYLELDVNQDWAFVTLYSLNKHLKNVLPVLEEIIKTPVFPKEELGILLNNKKQHFLVDNQKVSYLARTRFSNIIFGSECSYSYKLSLNHFDELTHEDLVYFYEKHYTPKNCTIVVSGKADESIISILNQHFGLDDWGRNTSVQSEKIEKINPSTDKKHFIEKKDAVQSAIRIGRPLFNKLHPDYHAMKVLSTLLGGYFGSRLMLNIREDKGYTYGIGSRIISLQNAGYFFISTEVGVDVCSNAIKEVYHEIDKLRSEPVSKDELDRVKNYMLGDFLRSTDGPFALADKFKKIMFYNLNYNYYADFTNTIKTITPNRLQELANKYLAQDDLYELVAGAKNN